MAVAVGSLLMTAEIEKRLWEDREDGLRSTKLLLQINPLNRYNPANRACPSDRKVLVKMPKNLEHHPLRGLYSLAAGPSRMNAQFLNILVVTVDNSDLKPVKTHVAII